MSCDELREYLFVFLDSELDAALSIEVQRHLERCATCAREAEIERAIRKHLEGSLAREADPEREEDILRRSTAAPPRRRLIHAPPLHWRRRFKLAGAFVIVLVGVVLLWQRHSPSRSNPLSASVLVGDFEHFLASGKPLHVETEDAHEVADWARREFAWNIEMPVMRGKCRLVGARRCKVLSRPAALALYDMEGDPATLLVMAREGTDLEQMPRIDGHWEEGCKGHSVVASEHHDLIYAAVGRVSAQELMHLMPGQAGRAERDD